MKYHFISRQAVERFTAAEAELTAGRNADYHHQGLFEAVERGDYPIWDVKVQIMLVADAESYRLSPFDVTKTWSKKGYPRIDVGYVILNRKPVNYQAQVEQIALNRGNIVPGIGFSPDRMLQGRVFVYADQHRYRIGPIFHQLPINQPLHLKNTYSHQGSMRASAWPTTSRRPRSASRHPSRSAASGPRWTRTRRTRERTVRAEEVAFLLPRPHGRGSEVRSVGGFLL